MSQKKAIVIRPVPGTVLQGETVPVFDIVIAGDFDNDGPFTLNVYQVYSCTWANRRPAERKIGTVTGNLTKLTRFHYRFSTPDVDAEADDPATDIKRRQAVIGLVFEEGGTPRYLRLPETTLPYQSSGNGQWYRFEGDDWELQARIEDQQMQSPVFRVSWTRRVVPARFADTKSAIYDWHAGNDVQFYQDATTNSAGDGYFGDVADAIAMAKSFVFIVDWSFNPTVILRPVAGGLGETLGAKLLVKAANDDVLVAIHTWYHGWPVAEGANDQAAKLFHSIAEYMHLAVSAKLLWRGGDRARRYFCHHQKFVLLDSVGPDGRSEVVAFYGGIDLTRGRSDTNNHPILPGDPDVERHKLGLFSDKGSFTRSGCSFDEWYNNEFEEYKIDLDPANPVYPREPWHDVHAKLRGPIAWDLLREFVGRWSQYSGSDEGKKIGAADTAQVWAKFHGEVCDRKKFIQQWEDYRPGPWSGQLLHSLDFAHFPPGVTNDTWHPKRLEFRNTIGTASERSIQNSYLKAIATAERFIYIENQYFIGSGDRWSAQRPSVQNGVPGALVDRIKHAIARKKPFHVYVVMPMMPEGKAVPSQSSAPPSVRALEFQTIAFMITEVQQALDESAHWTKYLSFYYPIRSDTTSSEPPLSARDLSRSDSEEERRRRLTFDNKRYMIYVHCKLMIVDDRFVMLGSANLNERSLAGDRDTEVCVALWPSSNRTEADCESAARQLRVNLMTEHMSGNLPANSDMPETEDFIDEFQRITKDTTNRLILGGAPLSRLAMLPIDAADDDGDPVWIRPEWVVDDPDAEFIVDSLLERPYWTWQSDINFAFSRVPTVIE